MISSDIEHETGCRPQSWPTVLALAALAWGLAAGGFFGFWALIRAVGL